jgi:hypothetical protein
MVIIGVPVVDDIFSRGDIITPEVDGICVDGKGTGY